MQVDFGKVQYLSCCTDKNQYIYESIPLVKVEIFSACFLSSRCSGVSAGLRILCNSFLQVFLCSLYIVSLTLSAWLMISNNSTRFHLTHVTNVVQFLGLIFISTNVEVYQCPLRKIVFR